MLQATGVVCSAECQFCRAFRKEASSNHGRGPRSNIKLFTKPWQQDHMKSHMLAQHPERFEEYNVLPSGEKESFFDASKNAGSRQVAEATKFFRRPISSEMSINVWIDKPIVEGIIGDMHYDPDDDDTMTKEQFMLVFKLQEGEPLVEDVDDGGTTRAASKEHYIATVSSKMQFYSCIKMIASGLLFRQASRVMQDMKKNARPFHASWAFLIALDGGNKSDTSYLDVRICVVSGNGVLSNLHLMAIPMRERHTRERMCDLASRVLDNLVPDWRCRMVSITTDGAASMTDQYRGVGSVWECHVTRILSRLVYIAPA
ncbi:hypothetical protein MHU86_3780 [Fragilaria crotonensis]|nr:hypothetical protein MHU86_3780 [Fragilaria crotonensis]